MGRTPGSHVKFGSTVDVHAHGLDPERALVAAVLRQALADAAHPPTHVTTERARQAIQAEARAFLADPERLGWWCTLAGVDVETFHRLMEEGGHG
jgi:hypothetical protein